MARSLNGPTSSTMQHGRVIPGLNLRAFQDAISDWGVTLVHYRAILCPIGQTDKYDQRKTHHAHSGCENGFIFERAGEVTCLFLGNGSNVQIVDAGQMVGATVNITFPPFYDDAPETPVTIAPNDRLELKEHKGYVVASQRFTVSGGNVDVLHFPAAKVEALIDSDGRRYHQDTDFEVRNGLIQWTASRPAPQAVCSVRYQYVPHWFVGQLVHEIRVAPTQDPVTGERSIERWPYSAICHRENVHRDEYSDPNDPLRPKEIAAPDSRESEILA